MSHTEKKIKNVNAETLAFLLPANQPINAENALSVGNKCLLSITLLMFTLSFNTI